MRGVQISHLIEHPEYISPLAQWLFEQWGSILGEQTPDARIEKLKAHMNRDKLPIAWVAHTMDSFSALRAFACMILRVARISRPGSVEYLSARSFVARVLCRSLCGRRGCHSIASHREALFVHARLAGVYSRLGWAILGPCVGMSAGAT